VIRPGGTRHGTLRYGLAGWEWLVPVTRGTVSHGWVRRGRRGSDWRGRFGLAFVATHGEAGMAVSGGSGFGWRGLLRQAWRTMARPV
jgi:hypothetical protein